VKNQSNETPLNPTNRSIISIDRSKLVSGVSGNTASYTINYDAIPKITIKDNQKPVTGNIVQINNKKISNIKINPTIRDMLKKEIIGGGDSINKKEYNRLAANNMVLNQIKEQIEVLPTPTPIGANAGWHIEKNSYQIKKPQYTIPRINMPYKNEFSE
jgi:hypothetical protein